MFRLAPLLTTAVALSDETSLMQGVKPQQVSTNHGKSKSVSNLLETAKTMLKNGATNDVLTFANETLSEIMEKVLPAIEASHKSDQKLIDDTFAAFDIARKELEAGNEEISALYKAVAGETLPDGTYVKGLSAQHKECRGTGDEDRKFCQNEYCTCEDKRDCDYALYAIWTRFVNEESILRDHSDTIENHFCAPDANGTTQKFRDTAVVEFKPWLEQKPIVEGVEVEYDAKVEICKVKYAEMDTKTDACDDLQTKLELASCAYANKVVLVKNIFSDFWDYQIRVYNDLSEEVHCLEIDRWKEWRTLESVKCLLEATSSRNGRPCDEDTEEASEEITKCETVQHDTDIEHLKIVYPHPCVPPPPCTDPTQTANCMPVEPHAPCSAEYESQEYAGLWEPPAAVFSETNSHCNARQECVACDVVPRSTICVAFATHGWTHMGKPKPEDECKQVTKDQLEEGDFGGRATYKGDRNYRDDGHFNPDNQD